MAKGVPNLPEHSLVSALVPPPGFECVGGVFSTYSLDLEVFLAALLAMVGSDQLEEEASIVQAQRAIIRLAKYTTVLCQRGRISVPRTKGRARLLSALDRCIFEQKNDERLSSWHAKAALIAYKKKEEKRASHWRLWLGSRNLTRSSDLDLGILFVGFNDTAKTAAMPGLGETLSAIFSPAQTRVPSGFFPVHVRPRRSARRREDQVSPWQAFETAVSWLSPPGIEIKAIAASQNRNAWRRVFDNSDILSDKSELLLAAPFVDTGGLSELQHWYAAGACHTAMLISTPQQLHSIPAANLQNLECREFGVPAEFSVQCPWPTDDDRDQAGDDDIAPERRARGVHAKLILSQPRRGDAALILGSPNLTRRGLRAREGAAINTEVAMRLSIPPTLADGLRHQLRGLSDCLKDPPTLSPAEAQRQEERDRLEVARKAFIASFDAALKLRQGELSLVLLQRVEIQTDFALSAAVQSRPTEKKLLNRDDRTVVLLRDVAAHEQTELVLFELTHVPSRSSCAWVQTIDYAEADDGWHDQRDVALAADLLTLDELYALIATELGSRGGDEGRSWHAAHEKTVVQYQEMQSEGFTLEALLRHRLYHPDAWSADWAGKIEGIFTALGQNTALSPHLQAQLAKSRQMWRALVSASSDADR